MKLLLVAYEFAPSASPQSLRWQYLCAELAAIGHEVRVLAPDSPDYHSVGLPGMPASIKVQRTFAGPFHGFLRARQKRRLNQHAPVVEVTAAGKGVLPNRPSAQGRTPLPDAASANTPQPATPAEELNWKGVLWHAGLNWKGRIFNTLQSCAAHVVYPDLRGEWMPWAKAGLEKELASFKPDVVLTSHEPATTLLLGLHAKRLGYRWVADMGDPVFAPYTPKRWRRRALRLEKAVCKSADLITVTADSVCRLMHDRHARDRGMLVIPQGYDARLGSPIPTGRIEDAPLQLLYTGSFYRFRAPDALIAAVVAVPGVRLTIASVNPPDSVRLAAKEHPASIELVGFQPHSQALRMQRQADVLVNIGNELPDQVPGKIYEYLGAGRPILHLSSGLDAGALEILQQTARAIVVRNTPEDLLSALRKLAASKDISSDFGLDMSPSRVQEFSWQASARRLSSGLKFD